MKNNPFLFVLGFLVLVVIGFISVFAWQVYTATTLSPEMQAAYDRWETTQYEIPEAMNSGKPYPDDLLESMAVFINWCETNDERLSGITNIARTVKKDHKMADQWASVREGSLQFRKRLDPLIDHPEYDFNIWSLWKEKPVWLVREQPDDHPATRAMAAGDILLAEAVYQASIQDEFDTTNMPIVSLSRLTKPGAALTNMGEMIRISIATQTLELISEYPEVLREANQDVIQKLAEREQQVAANFPENPVDLFARDHIGMGVLLARIGYPAETASAATGPGLMRLTGAQTNRYIDDVVIPGGAESARVEAMRQFANPPVDDAITMKSIFKITYPNMVQIHERMSRNVRGTQE